MAIVVEEEKRSGRGIIGILTWVVVGIIVLIAVYYIFFRRPELVEIAIPPSFQNAEELSRIELSPEEIVNNPVFQSLQIYVTSVDTPSGGRPNPFLAP